MIKSTKGGASAAPRAACTVGNALHETALAARIPQLHRARGARKSASFADTEQEANDDEGAALNAKAGGRSHGRPIGDKRAHTLRAPNRSESQPPGT